MIHGVSGGLPSDQLRETKKSSLLRLRKRPPLMPKPAQRRQRLLWKPRPSNPWTRQRKALFRPPLRSPRRKP